MGEKLGRVAEAGLATFGMATSVYLSYLAYSVGEPNTQALGYAFASVGSAALVAYAFFIDKLGHDAYDNGDDDE